MIKMKILSIPTTHGLFKPKIGAQNRFNNLIKGLIEEDKVVLLESEDFLVHNGNYPCKTYHYKDIKLSGRNLTILRDFNFDFFLKILKILKNEEIDMVQITHPSGIPLIKLAGLFSRKKFILVYDAYDVQSIFIKEVFADDLNYNKIEKFFMKVYNNFLETIICKYLADYITSVSEEERNILIEKYSLNKEKITVIPSGCNVTNISNIKKEKDTIKKQLGIDTEKIILFFHGAYMHPANKEAIEIIKNNISPKFRNSDCIFLIGGLDVPKFEFGNVKSLGYIENLEKILSIVDIAIVPLMRGTGTKLKIFDYMNAGIPIISTKKGIEGIKTHTYDNSIIVNGIDDLNNAINYLMHNKKERNRIGANARKLAENEYDWIKIREKLENLFEIIGSKNHAVK